MAENLSISFLCGQDDFLVDRQARALFDQYASPLSDPLSHEILDGFVNNASEAQAAIKNFTQALQSVPMFGDTKTVWFKSINFISDSVTGRAESTKLALDSLIELLPSLTAPNLNIILSASPVDRRTKQFKKLQKITDLKFIETQASPDALLPLVIQEAKALECTISQPAALLLIEKTASNSRLLLSEVQKLACFLNSPGAEISESLIHELVPQFGQGDFFEVSEAFFSMDLNWTLQAIDRHFFHSSESRPILSALQNKNRLLIQLRALLDAKISVNKNTLEALQSTHNFPGAEKSSFNLPSQNPWYLSRLAQIAQKIPLKQLLSFQKAFIDLFVNILNNPNSQHQILRNSAIQFLS